MSTTAVGIALDLDGPLPVPRPFRLLATPGVLQDPGDGRWIGSVNVYGYPDGTPLAWEPCSDGTNRTKSSAVGGQPGGLWNAVAIYFPLTCSTHGMRDPSAFNDRVELALDATISMGVEDVLANGTPGSSNAFLGDGNMDVLAGGSAVSAVTGLGYLENAIAELTGRKGMIHATPAVTAVWGFNYLQTDGESMSTIDGTPVVSGAGYIGSHPLGPGGLPGPGATTDWVFASGPAEVFIADETRFEILESIDHSDNTLVVRAEKYVLAEWDQALQVGILIDWSL